MLFTHIQRLYRLLAVLLVLMPVVINLIVVNDLVTSLLYVPLGCLLLSVFFIFIDHRLTMLLRSLTTKPKVSGQAKLAKPCTNLHQHKWCCIH